jgi:hypothetical protein
VFTVAALFVALAASPAIASSDKHLRATSPPTTASSAIPTRASSGLHRPSRPIGRSVRAEVTFRRSRASSSCPEPCPELGRSERTSANEERLSKPKGVLALVKRSHFKTGRPVQPTGWKVRFLRRSVALVPNGSTFKPFDNLAFEEFHPDGADDSGHNGLSNLGEVRQPEHAVRGRAHEPAAAVRSGSGGLRSASATRASRHAPPCLKRAALGRPVAFSDLASSGGRLGCPPPL